MGAACAQCEKISRLTSVFNPRSIHVSRAEAEWKEQGGRLSLFVELLGVNYPG
jgi:hypothetical protein